MDGDISKEDPKYWEDVLVKDGLSMDAGLTIPKHDGRPGKEVISYVGTSENLVGIEQEQNEIRTGRVKPSGSGPD